MDWHIFLAGYYSGIMTFVVLFAVIRAFHREQPPARRRFPPHDTLPRNKDGKSPVIWIGGKPLYTAAEIEAELKS